MLVPVQTTILRVVRGVLADDPEHWLGSDMAIPGVGANNGLTIAPVPGTIKRIVIQTHFYSSNPVYHVNKLKGLFNVSSQKQICMLLVRYRYS